MAYQTRTHRIYAAVTSEEYEVIQELADAHGVSAATWIYMAVEAHAKREGARIEAIRARTEKQKASKVGGFAKSVMA